jgi:hypothetical protein
MPGQSARSQVWPVNSPRTRLMYPSADALCHSPAYQAPTHPQMSPAAYVFVPVVFNQVSQPS